MKHRARSNTCVRMSMHDERAVFLHVKDARLFAANAVGC